MKNTINGNKEKENNEETQEARLVIELHEKAVVLKKFISLLPEEEKNEEKSRHA